MTLHGVTNAMVLTTFLAVALGNVFVSQELESPFSLFGAGLLLALMLLGAASAVMVFAGKATVAYYTPIRDMVRIHVPGAFRYHPDSLLAVELQR